MKRALISHDNLQRHNERDTARALSNFIALYLLTQSSDSMRIFCDMRYNT
jgi:hypothetical protein